MENLKQILTFEYGNAYESAYDLTLKKNYSNPKIYSANGNLSKRWYVYFSFRHPETGRLKRLTPFYGIANTFRTKEERMEVLVVYRKTLLKLLEQGYNPFKDNSELFNSLNSKTAVPAKKKGETADTPEEEKVAAQNHMTIRETLEKGLKLKEKLISSTTRRSYQNRLKLFLNWIDEHYPKLKTINEVNKKVMLEFLNDVLDRTSARNRNNYRTDLGSIFQVLEDNEIVAQNFVKRIPVLKSTPKRHKRYTQEMQERIFEYLTKKDHILLLYIKFISYGFLRPKEVCRLRVKDVDLKNKTLQFKAKNSPLKTKIIPNILFEDIPDLSKLDRNAFLFTPNQIGANWDATTDNRRDYFSKRYRKLVKDHFGLGNEYGLYSFRHTYIAILYRALEKGSSPFSAKSKLMLITGHTSMKALEKYLRDIDAELPEDYSDKLKQNNG